MTDIEIAQASKMLPIEEIAAKVMANADKLMNRGGAPAAPRKLGQVNLTAEVDEDEA